MLKPSLNDSHNDSHDGSELLLEKNTAMEIKGPGFIL